MGLESGQLARYSRLPPMPRATPVIAQAVAFDMGSEDFRDVEPLSGKPKPLDVKRKTRLGKHLDGDSGCCC
jgi:hypothetical protein